MTQPVSLLLKPLELFIKQPRTSRPDQISLGLLKPGSMMEIFGATGTLKTWVSMDLALSLTSGTRWLCWETFPSRVIVVNSEMSEEEYQLRWEQKLVLDKRVALPNWFHIHCGELKIDTYEGAAQLLHAIQQTQTSVVIIDNLYTSLSGSLTNNQDLLKLRINCLAILKAGCSLIVVHHMPQMQFHNGKQLDFGSYGGYGGSFLPNMLDTAFELRRNGELVTVIPQKNRLSPCGARAASFKFEGLQFELEME